MAETAPSAQDLASAGVRLDVRAAPGGTAEAIATVTLARPERRNAMTPATWRALADIGATLPPEVRIVVVRGEGPSFSAGLDLRMLQPDGGAGEPGLAGLAEWDEARIVEWIAVAQQGYTWLRRPDIVSVAAVHGHAIGAGFQLALACDVRVLADDAKLCMKEPALGLVPDLTGTKPLVDLVGVHRAMELCLTARTVGAAEARELGLAERVVPAADLDAAVDELITQLLAVPRDAAAATKELLLGAPLRSLEEQSAAERRAQAARLRAIFGG